MIRLLFAATIFSSAFLLFLVQPLISKQILPWFGGAAAVWTTCMVFFQGVLLAGYAYSDWTARRLAPRSQALLHGALLLASCCFLPIAANPAFKPAGGEDPSLRILLLLGLTIGLPYFLLSTTGPLVQAWIARTLPCARVYRYYSLSNLASLIALVSYPFVIEPRVPLLRQSRAWSGMYVLFALLCAACALLFARRAKTAALEPAREQGEKPVAAPAPRDCLLWLALSAMGSWLLIAVTNHITQNIAAIPFLWLLPLTVYLLSFILCFDSDRWYARRRFLPPAALSVAACAWGLQHGILDDRIRLAVPLYAAGLFFCCMFLHGELARMRPAPRYLTRFYLMLSLGGASGGIAVGLLAPRVLAAPWELGIGLIVVALLAALVLRPSRTMQACAFALAVACGYFLYRQIEFDLMDTRLMRRNFYASLRTADLEGITPDDDARHLFHGTIRHGAQYLASARRRAPTTYYGTSSGIGIALHEAPAAPRRIGLIGLGAGTLAAYGRQGDVYRFYEINPQVIAIARSEFSFLDDTPAQVETVPGDARLALEREPPQGFDVLAVDAFSGDAIPVHLITREAMDTYLRHMKPDGVIAFHVTNRFLSLAPVVQRLARDRGLPAVLIRDDGERTTAHYTDWVLVARNPAVLRRPAILGASSPIAPIAGLGVWTDDFNNLFDVLK